MVRILRASVKLDDRTDEVIVYMQDEEMGKAVVSQAAFNRYIQALSEIETFEQDVDKQYDHS